MSVPASSYACSQAEINGLSPQPPQDLHVHMSSDAETCSTPLQCSHRCQAAMMHTASAAPHGKINRVQMCFTSSFMGPAAKPQQSGGKLGMPDRCSQWGCS